MWVLGTSATLSTSEPSGTARLTVSPVRCESFSMAGCIVATRSKLRSATLPSRMTSSAEAVAPSGPGQETGPLQGRGQP